MPLAASVLRNPDSSIETTSAIRFTASKDVVRRGEPRIDPYTSRTHHANNHTSRAASPSFPPDKLSGP